MLCLENPAKRSSQRLKIEAWDGWGWWRWVAETPTAREANRSKSIGLRPLIRRGDGGRSNDERAAFQRAIQAVKLCVLNRGNAQFSLLMQSGSTRPAAATSAEPVDNSVHEVLRTAALSKVDLPRSSPGWTCPSKPRASLTGDGDRKSCNRLFD